MKAGLNVMKLFIGWSGETSGKIASILAKWLDKMFDKHINIVSPASTEEIGKYLLVDADVDMKMNTADCGLLCVTEDNANSQWLAYEAGILSLNAQFVIPLLFGVNVASLGAPLQRFEPFWFGYDGILELTRKLNDLLGEDALPAEELERRFPARYPVLEGIVQDTLEENEPQTREDWARNELDEISAQLAELTKRVERLKTNISAANRSRKYSRVSR